MKGKEDKEKREVKNGIALYSLRPFQIEAILQGSTMQPLFHIPGGKNGSHVIESIITCSLYLMP